jgi:RraA family protein
MAIGFRAYTKIKRADIKLVEAFRDIPVANISDNMGRIACVDTAIRPYCGVPLLGVAVTVKAAPGDNLMFHKALDMAQPGDVIMVDGEGAMSHSLCGEIMYRYAQSRGIAGFVIDGCIRDVEALERLGFPVYARGVQPKGPYKNGPGEINVPVAVGGIAVRPGDIIVGDTDGVVIVKEEDAAALIELANKMYDNEQIAFENIAKGTFNRDWVDAAIFGNGGEIIDDYA